MRRRFKLKPFTAREVSNIASEPDSSIATEWREMLDDAAQLPAVYQMRAAVQANPKAVAKRLKAIVGNPVRIGDEQLMLRCHRVPGGSDLYYVEVKPVPAAPAEEGDEPDEGAAEV
jgi:hypothetical protein